MKGDLIIIIYDSKGIESADSYCIIRVSGSDKEIMSNHLFHTNHSQFKPFIVNFKVSDINQGKISFQLFKKNIFQDIFLGACHIDLNSIHTNGSIWDNWFPLFSNPQSLSSNYSLHLKLSLKIDNNLSSSFPPYLKHHPILKRRNSFPFCNYSHSFYQYHLTSVIQQLQKDLLEKSYKLRILKQAYLQLQNHAQEPLSLNTSLSNNSTSLPQPPLDDFNTITNTSTPLIQSPPTRDHDMTHSYHIQINEIKQQNKLLQMDRSSLCQQLVDIQENYNHALSQIQHLNQKINKIQQTIPPSKKFGLPDTQYLLFSFITVKGILHLFPQFLVFEPSQITSSYLQVSLTPSKGKSEHHVISINQIKCLKKSHSDLNITLLSGEEYNVSEVQEIDHCYRVIIHLATSESHYIISSE